MTFKEEQVNKLLENSGRNILMNKSECRSIVYEIINISKYKNEYTSNINHLLNLHCGIIKRLCFIDDIKQLGITEVIIKTCKEIKRMEKLKEKYIEKILKIESIALCTFPEHRITNSTILFKEKKSNDWISNHNFKFIDLNCNLLEDGRKDTNFYDIGHVFYYGTASVYIYELEYHWIDFSFNISKINVGEDVSNNVFDYMSKYPSELRSIFKTDKELYDVIKESSPDKIILNIAIKNINRSYEFLNFDKTFHMFSEEAITEIINYVKKLYDDII